MAVTYLEKVKQNQQQQQNQQQGLRGVSQQTQQQLQAAQQPYQQTAQAQQAQQNLQQVQAQKPQGYTSKYGGALENILQQIQNPQGFKYSFAGDNLFQYYKDMYTQQAKQGAADAAGIAAGLTGGYGNTYAQAAANQAYQQNLMPLYDKGIDFMNAAYNRYAAERDNQYNQLGALQNAENAEYGRYRDLVSDYQADLDRAREDARYEDETGYNRYADMLKYWQNQAAAENADYQAGQEMEYRYNTLDEQARQADMDEAYRRDAMVQDQQQFEATTKLDYDKLAENVRQFDASLSEDQRQYNQKYASSWVADILANGQIPSMELLAMAGLSYEDAQKLVAQVQAAGPGGPAPKETKDPKELQALFQKNLQDPNRVTPAEYNEFRQWHNETGGDLGPQYAPETSNLDTPIRVTRQVEANPGSGQNTTKNATTTMTPAQYNQMIRKLVEEDLKKRNG